MNNVISIYKLLFFSASASVSYKFDFGKKFEEFLAKWKEALKQKEENTEENNKENKG